MVEGNQEQALRLAEAFELKRRTPRSDFPEASVPETRVAADRRVTVAASAQDAEDRDTQRGRLFGWQWSQAARDVRRAARPALAQARDRMRREPRFAQPRTLTEVLGSAENQGIATISASSAGIPTQLPTFLDNSGRDAP